MARVFSQGRRISSGNGGNGSGRLTLKEDIRKDWYFYRVSDHTVVKPYPVFDENGRPCPCREDGIIDDENPSFLPQSMVVAPVATWAGMDGKLEFIDICSDAEEFTDETGEIANTPYTYLLRFLRGMTSESSKKLPEARDGMEYHPEAQKIVKYLRYPGPCVIFRGALIIDKGDFVTGQKVTQVNSRMVDGKKAGILLNAFCFISQKSARTKFYERFNELYSQDDEGDEVTAENCYFKNIFKPDQGAVEFLREAKTDEEKRTAPFKVSSTKKYQHASFIHTELNVA